MKRVRNAVAIIVLCIIGAAMWGKKAPQLALTPEPELKDAVSGNPVRASRAVPPGLTLTQGEDNTLRDAVAGNAVGTPAPNGNSVEDVPPPPRGSGEGGFGPLGDGNPGQNIVPPPLSPSGPPSETPSEQYYPESR